MLTIETIRLKIRKAYVRLTRDKRRRKIKNDDFTIISNNCWGGLVYQSYNLQYRTPTVGLFFMAEDYIKFVKDIKRYISMPLEFIYFKDSKWYELEKHKEKFGKYPIAKLDDIEIHFLHYNSVDEAREKWTKRCKRINWDKLLIKYNDQNHCTYKELEEFNKLPYSNKICFTCKEYKDLDNIYIKIPKRYSEIKASYEPFGKSKYININEIINKL